MRAFAEWYPKKNLELNTSKTKVMVIDFRRQRGVHASLTVKETCEERVIFKLMGVHVTEDLTWTTNTSALVKKTQQTPLCTGVAEEPPAGEAADVLLSSHHRISADVLSPCSLLLALLLTGRPCCKG